MEVISNKEFMLIDDSPEWVFTMRIQKTGVIGFFFGSSGECGFSQSNDVFMVLNGMYDKNDFIEICRQNSIDFIVYD